MQNLKKKHTIKIPNNVAVLYCNKKNIITIIGPLSKKSLKLETKIEILNDKNLILIHSIPFLKMPNSKKRKNFALQGTTAALIKQIILETSYTLYQKLKFIGVGYRAFDVESLKNKLMLLKLGYSHPIYIKTPLKSQIFCLKNTKLFIYGNSYQDITQYASFIRSYKKPEPYKGKGILYYTEKITLKEGKKV